MSKRKVELDEAKKILNNDKIFYSGNNKFNVLDVGKYHSGITLEIPQEWDVNDRNLTDNPIAYMELRKLTDGMNIDFDGKAELLLGKYRLSKNGKPVFELTEPIKAKDALIRVAWGGAFNKTRGQHKGYANEVGATYYVQRSSNGGGAGKDYWILPVGFVNGRESRDVSDILKEVQEKKDARIAEADAYLEQKEKERQESIKNRERIIQEIQPIISEIQSVNPESKFELGDEYIEYGIRWMRRSSRYNDSVVNDLQELLEKEISKKTARDEFMPQYKEMEEVILSIESKLQYYDEYVRVDTKDFYLGRNTYGYNTNDYVKFVEDVSIYREKFEKMQEDARRKVEEMKKAEELRRLKQEAKENGYPEEFEFWNRVGGKTGLSHAYVIRKDGSIREPDDNRLRNNNHRHLTNWLNTADGTQVYNQIMPGEIIISYVANHIDNPHIFNVEWADGEINDLQLETLFEEFQDLDATAIDKEDNEITSIREWAKNASKEKSKVCRTQLKINDANIEKTEEQEFAETIVNCANKKVEVRNTNAQAKQLLNDYEQQLPKQKIWEGNQ